MDGDKLMREEKYKTDQKTPVIFTEQEHKVFLLTNDQKALENKFDMIRNQMQLSNIGRNDVRIIRMHMDLASEYYDMGCYSLSNDHLFEVMTTLNLHKSVAAVGLITQVGDIVGKATMKPNQPADIEMQGQEKDEDKGGLDILGKIGLGKKKGDNE